MKASRITKWTTTQRATQATTTAMAIVTTQTILRIMHRMLKTIQRMQRTVTMSIAARRTAQAAAINFNFFLEGGLEKPPFSLDIDLCKHIL